MRPNVNEWTNIAEILLVLFMTNTSRIDLQNNINSPISD